MSACQDIDALMMDWLYEELGQTDQARFDAHVATCARCQSELASFTRTREAVRALPELEPPPALSAQLLHEAAKRAPQSKVKAADGERPGFWAWLVGMFQPMAAHPALSAVATLVLVAGVTSALYLSGGFGDQQSRVASQAEPPAAASAKLEHRAETTSADKAIAAPKAGETAQAAALDSGGDQGFEVDLATEDTKIRGILADTEERQLKSMDEKLDALAATDRRTQAIEQTKRRGPTGPANKAPKRSASAITEAEGLIAPNGDALGGVGREFANAPGAGGRSATLAVEGAEDDADGEAAASIAVAQQAPATPPRARPEPAKPAPPAKPKPTTRRATKSKSPTAAKKNAEPQRRSRTRNDAPEAEPSPDRDKDSNRAWAERQELQMKQALRKDNCSLAARYANDIRDRARRYYDQRISGSKELARCRTYVENERKRRANRAKAAKAAPKKAVEAAPADEISAEEE
jgi:hypothetical protein